MHVANFSAWGSCVLAPIELKQLVQMDELIFHSAKSPMVVCTINGKILRVNTSITEVFGYNEIELIGDCVTRLMTTDTAARYAAFTEK